MTESRLSSMDEALDAYRSGNMVIIVDDEDRENEGDVVLAAEFATPETINFMVTHARGLVCLAMRGALLDRLKIPMMVPQSQNRSGFGTGFTISVEAVNGVSTGISAEDRSHTIHTLIDPNTTPDDIAMPGHIFPLRARDGGVLERRGQTEASVDMSALAGLTPAGIICEVMREDGTMMRLDELLKFGKEHNLPVISVEQIAEYRLQLGQGNMATAVTTDSPQTQTAEPLAIEIGRSVLPTAHGTFDFIVFRDQQGFEHSALIKGDLLNEPPMVRIHSECLTGDAFGSLRCDCGPQLHTAMQQIEDRGDGVILYLRQEGRGIGLGNKIRAYALQDEGRDTVDANHELGFPADARTYDVAAEILKQLGLNAIKLMSNNPAKREAIEALGIEIAERIPLAIDAQSHNMAYLETKANRMGHNYHADDV
ncbi:MAG: 3,4-dihydroxy-2-butanone-4-phosphate synthase [Granulosicoccus sp.]